MSVSPLDRDLLVTSETLSTDIEALLDGPLYSADARLRVSATATDIAILHARAVRQLFATRLPVSATIVMRAQFEALLRACWLLYVAPDTAIAKLGATLDLEGEQVAKNLAGADEMLQSLQRARSAQNAVAVDMLTEFKQYHWRALNSFTHTGLHAITRAASPGFPVALAETAIRHSNGLLLMAGMLRAILSGRPDLIQRVKALQVRYVPVFPPVSPPATTTP